VESLPIIPRRSEVIRNHKQRGAAVAAVLPIHYPRALLRAFGVFPIEVWGPPAVDASYKITHLQPYICSIVQNALSFLQAGGLDVVDLIVVPHACDTLQGLGSILIDFVAPRQPILPIYIPRGERESDVSFLADEFRSLYRRLEEITGRTPSEAELAASIRREEKADALLGQFHRRRKHLSLTSRDFYRLIRSREYLPAETFAELAQAATEQATETTWDGVPILLSGIIPEPMSVLDALAEIGGMVVADDLACCGRRLYPVGASAPTGRCPPGESDEPFRRMAERILHAPPDSTRGSPVQARLDHLLRLAKESGARGVVFYNVKFCEPELFYIPGLRRGLQDAGIPSVVVEVDIGDPLSHQVITRLEAFLEMMT
jgi:benzoyl-CoA reductase/2-hydroxyglutaryl-CoA dehydratase subunit BcrC/BadD/HgdB